MSQEADLLRSLDDEPDTPSTVDIRRAISTARRHKNRRNAGYAGAAAVTALAVAGTPVMVRQMTDEVTPPVAGTAPAPAASATTRPTYSIPGRRGWAPAPAEPPATCEIDRLPAPDGAPMSLVSGADPTGRYIVGRTYPEGGGYQAVLWNSGQPVTVPMPGDEEELLTDVNTGGTAVGWSFKGGAPIPYAYAGGKVTKLAGVKKGSAHAINDAGAIVGDNDAGKPMVWPSPTAAPDKLPVPGGVKEAQARDIDEDGTVVGSLDMRTPYVWFADGTHRALPMPELDGKPAGIAQAFHVRNGIATGMAGPAPAAAKDKGREGRGAATPVHAVRWDVRTGESQVVEQLKHPADAVNAQGWQVGTDRRGYAAFFTGGDTIKLPVLGKDTPDGVSTIASTLSDDGRVIAGQSDDKDEVIQAVVWRCR